MERRLVILYGSQTGTAQAVAERVFREAKRLRFRAEVRAMDAYRPVGRLLEERLAVFVCSTAGQGDPPSNMAAFWKFLLRKNLPPDSLDGLNYGVLGLGDSSYRRFNFAAKRLHRRLLGLGARAAVAPGLADDQHDLGPDAVIDPWLEAFWREALRLMPLPDGVAPVPAHTRPPPRFRLVFNGEPEAWRGPPDAGDPIPATLMRCERVTAADHFQDTRLVELDVPGRRYAPGDVCLVQPSNLEENVAGFYRLFPRLPDPDAVFSLQKTDPDVDVPSSVPARCTLRHCVEKVFDLQAVPGRYFFELLAHFSADSEDGRTERDKLREFASATGQQDLYDYCHRPRRHALEVLHDFRHTAPHVPLEYLFDLFPVIKPRAFSIASSSERTPGKIRLLVAVVAYRSKLLVAPRLGLCSNFLRRLAPGSKVPIWIEKRTLRFPPAPVPVVAVGPGTGISPFLAFSLQEHGARPLCVFFGCRSESKDFYLRREWEAMLEVTLVTAFSRDQEDKIYVQHRIEENAALVADLLVNRGGWFYVAGNAKQMPDQVRDAVLAVISKHFQDDEKGARYLDKMEAEGRYQTETWS